MPSQNAPAPVHKKTWTEVPLKNDSKPATPTSDGDWELLGGKDVQKQAEMTLPAKSPYVEDKTLEDVRILERQSKSEIDPEHWEVATLAGRQRKATIRKLISADVRYILTILSVQASGDRGCNSGGDR